MFVNNTGLKNLNNDIEPDIPLEVAVTIWGRGASGRPLRSYRTRPSGGDHGEYTRAYLRPEHLRCDCPGVGGVRARAGGWLYCRAPIRCFSDGLRVDPIGAVHRLHPPLAAVRVLHRRRHSPGRHPGSPSHRSAPNPGWCCRQRQSLNQRNGRFRRPCYCRDNRSGRGLLANPAGQVRSGPVRRFVGGERRRNYLVHRRSRDRRNPARLAGANLAGVYAGGYSRCLHDGLAMCCRDAADLPAGRRHHRWEASAESGTDGPTCR